MPANYWTRRTISRRTVVRGIATGGVGAGALALVGCGDDDSGTKPASATAARPSTTTAATTAASAAASPSASAAAQPRRGGTVVYANGGEPPNLDVHKQSSAYLAGYGPGAAYSQLIKPQATGHKGTVIPVGDLAAKWEQPDKSTYIFTLRQGAKFQNIAPVNGRVVVADDVLYSFKRQIAEKVNASYLAGVKNMVVVDPSTFKFELDKPNVDFMTTFTDPHNKVVAHEVIDQNGSLEKEPVIGSGAWIFKEWVKGSATNFVRNPDYFLPQQPYADALQMPLIKDEAQLVAQFSQGNITIARVGSASQGLPNAFMSKIDKTKYGVYSAAPVSGNWVMYGQNFAAFKDVRVRKALAMAIDRDLIIQNVLDGNGMLDALGVVLPGADWRLSQEELKKLLPYDPKAAKAMLDAAGGPPAKQTMPTYESPATLAMAQIVQSNWKAAFGFETEIQSVDSIGLANGIYLNTATFTVACAAISHPASTTADLQAWFVTGGPRNGVHMSDPDVDRLVAAQQVEFDEKARRDLINQLQRLMIDKAYVSPLQATISQTAYPLKAHNVEPPPGTATYSHFAEVWFDA